MNEKNKKSGESMIKKFEVSNYKCFKEKMVFDLTAHNYEFNNQLIKNGIVNKAIIYGKNGVGKSNLGYAIFDIITHLTDKQKMPSKMIRNYINLETSINNATFKYYFQFDEDEVVYEYAKKGINDLIYEELYINDQRVVYFHYFETKNNFVDEDLKGDLNIDLIDNKLSVIKYIYKNTPTNNNVVLTKMMNFCENMLWYRSLSDGNAYCGFTNGRAELVEILYQSGKIHEFESFLQDNDLNYKLSFESNNGEHELIAHFNRRKAPFVEIASTGTMALFLFFTWSYYFNNISFLFIDEFDAFFHFESAETIIKKLNQNKRFQTLLTSHNTYLMQNKLTRPDCCYILTKNKITNLVNCTDKEIREAHNLEKMYVNGAFNE